MIKLLVQFSNYLLQILPILTCTFYKNEICIHISENKLIPILFFLKNHTNSQFKVLSEICAVDYILNQKRFEIIYNLLSIRYNSRLKLKIRIDELQSIPSVSKIYPSANWSEREIWDLFGIVIFDHPDLRRILTDYGFEGHPLRKDFPLSGFLEMYYNESKKRVVYVPISLSQQYRLMEFNSPWNQKL